MFRTILITSVVFLYATLDSTDGSHHMPYDYYYIVYGV